MIGSGYMACRDSGVQITVLHALEIVASISTFNVNRATIEDAFVAISEILNKRYRLC